MLGLSATKIFAGIAAGLLITTLAMGWALRHEIQQSAVLRADLRDAISANATLIESRNKARAEAEAEQARAIQRQRERDGMAGQLVELRRALGDDPCAWTPERARAIDEFLGGGVK